jgi:hypothetical protein
MPVVFKGKVTTKTETCNKAARTGNRRKHFEACVQKLVPIIRELRAAGVKDIRTFMERLNAMGIAAPNGGPFSYGTMLRVWERAKALGLDEGPRSQSKAASERPYRFTSNFLKAAKQKEMTKLLAALPPN